MSAKTAVRDYSVELSGADSYRLKTYLQSQRIQFESSGCWNLVHSASLVHLILPKRSTIFLKIFSM